MNWFTDSVTIASSQNLANPFLQNLLAAMDQDVNFNMNRDSLSNSNRTLTFKRNLLLMTSNLYLINFQQLDFKSLMSLINPLRTRKSRILLNDDIFITLIRSYLFANLLL